MAPRTTPTSTLLCTPIEDVLEFRHISCFVGTVKLHEATNGFFDPWIAPAARSSDPISIRNHLRADLMQSSLSSSVISVSCRASVFITLSVSVLATTAGSYASSYASISSIAQ
jgi:hypothetical protein